MKNWRSATPQRRADLVKNWPHVDSLHARIIPRVLAVRLPASKPRALVSDRRTMDGGSRRDASAEGATLHASTCRLAQADDLHLRSTSGVLRRIHHGRHRDGAAALRARPGVDAARRNVSSVAEQRHDDGLGNSRGRHVDRVRGRDDSGDVQRRLARSGAAGRRARSAGRRSEHSLSARIGRHEDAWPSTTLERASRSSIAARSSSNFRCSCCRPIRSRRRPVRSRFAVARRSSSFDGRPSSAPVVTRTDERVDQRRVVVVAIPGTGSLTLHDSIQVEQSMRTPNDRELA